jgi:putative nucleotidyltransferase with HDIG domain
LPLAVLLKMTLVFPDQAPKRMAVARKAGSTRDLARRVQEAKDHGMRDAPVIAAEKILVLAGALNVHDRRTRGHSERVRMYTDLIAEEMKLPQVDRDRLRWSALLHDIGKVAVHPDILNKPGALDDEEWEQVKNHPLEGAKLTAHRSPRGSVSGRTRWPNTTRSIDGSGYPRGSGGPGDIDGCADRRGRRRLRRDDRDAKLQTGDDSSSRASRIAGLRRDALRSHRRSSVP